MHKRLYGLLEINNVLHSLQLGFRKKHSISHILIIMTEQIRNTIDMGVLFSLTSKKLLILLITPYFKKDGTPWGERNPTPMVRVIFL